MTKIILLIIILCFPVSITAENISIEKNYSITELRTIVDEQIAYYNMKKHSVFIHTIVRVESNYNQLAKNKTAPCFGLFQLLLSTARIYNNIETAEMLFNPSINAKSGVAHLKHLITTYPKMEYETIMQMYNLGETGFLNGKRNPNYLAMYNTRLIEELEYRKLL